MLGFRNGAVGSENKVLGGSSANRKLSRNGVRGDKNAIDILPVCFEMVLDSSVPYVERGVFSMHRWTEVLPIEHITIDAVNEWAWTKKKAGTTWGVIKDALRTMQRVLSAFSKEGKPPFSLRG